MNKWNIGMKAPCHMCGRVCTCVGTDEFHKWIWTHDDDESYAGERCENGRFKNKVEIDVSIDYDFIEELNRL